VRSTVNSTPIFLHFDLRETLHMPEQIFPEVSGQAQSCERCPHNQTPVHLECSPTATR
jgi:hypothetical protein